ncbi:AI-2E family transporter [Pseudactinotalea terrae]|uniref:AI-2E family transporter n=1 Tax=Pseudactinotalea terrae TaxID=1743262 RepID=UPI0012E2242A|nr:AI-2E family transporter [Pseudactinotalea terrae]
MGWLRSGRSRDVVVVRETSPLTTRPTDTATLQEAHRSSVPAPVRAASEWSWRLILIVIGVTLVVAGLVWLKTVVVPVLVATLLASLLAPLTGWLCRRFRFPRVLAVLTTLVGVIAVVGGLVTLAGSSIADGFPALRDQATAGFDDALAWLSSGPLRLDEATLSSWVDQLQEQLSSNSEAIVSGALSLTTSAGHIAAGALIALFCLFFFLLEGRRIWTWVVGLFPRVARARIDGAGLRGWISLGTYARTQILVAFVDGIGIGLFAWLLGVPLPVPLGILVFVGAFIPIIGALVTGSVAVAVALVDGGILTAVLMLAAVLFVQQVEGNLLQPLLMSQALRLHPVAVLLAVATGTLVGGIVGALFAVPLIAVANTAIKYLNGKDPIPDRLKGEFEELTRRWQQT